MKNPKKKKILLNFLSKHLKGRRVGKRKRKEERKEGPGDRERKKMPVW